MLIDATGTLGMPCWLQEVVEKLADLRHTTPTAIVATVEANFIRLIQDDPRLAHVRTIWT
jgi:Tat protein secretion system quality control protein TatD with DNase activity